jgi:hypothetical protein
MDAPPRDMTVRSDDARCARRRRVQGKLVPGAARVLYVAEDRGIRAMIGRY